MKFKMVKKTRNCKGLLQATSGEFKKFLIRKCHKYIDIFCSDFQIYILFCSQLPERLARILFIHHGNQL